MTRAEYEQFLDEIALTDYPEQLAELRHVVAQEHAGDPYLASLLEWIDDRIHTLEERRELEPNPAPSPFGTFRPHPITPALFNAYARRIATTRTRAELVVLMRRIKRTYLDDPRWPALREEGRRRLEMLEQYVATRPRRLLPKRGTT